MNVYRTCHNKKCKRPFQRLRVNQRHCDTICKERCVDCRTKYHKKRNDKLRVLRRERSVG